MSKKYDICTRLEIQGRDKPIWPKVGMTLTIRDDGKISLYDARTGQSYFAFERQDRQQKPEPQSQSSDDGFNDSIPF